MRRLLLALLALALLVAGAFAFSIDRLARTAIERDAGRALGVGVSLRFIHLRPLAGALHVSHLAIANPPGFEGAHFLALRKLDLGLDLRSLRRDVVRVPRFALVGVDVSLERRGRESNTAAILANLKRFEAAGAAPNEPAAQGPEKRFRVARLVIRDITAKVEWNDLASRASALDVKLESIELSEPGGARGLTLSELSNVVVKAVLDGLRTSGQLPVEVALDLAGGLRGLAQLPIAVTGGVLEGAGGLVGGKAGEALDAAGGAVRDAGAAVERGVEGVFERARREPEK
jgi:hypothetical protein